MVPLKDPGAKLGSVGVPPPTEPPGPPYRDTKEESLLPVDKGEIGPPGPVLFITMLLSRRFASHVTGYTRRVSRRWSSGQISYRSCKGEALTSDVSTRSLCSDLRLSRLP